MHRPLRENVRLPKIHGAVLLILLTALFMLSASSCASPEPVTYKDGEYLKVLDNGYDLLESPILQLHAEDSSWTSSPTVYSSFALSGTYEIKNDLIYAEDNTKQVVVVFRIQDEETLVIKKAVWRYNGAVSWFTRGDVYSFLKEIDTAGTAEAIETTDAAETTEEASSETTAAVTETSEEVTETGEETTGETTPEPGTEAKAPGPTVAEGPVKDMIRMGLNYVSAGYGYSLQDRQGVNGSFDCSGLVSVLLRDSFGCTNYGWDGGTPWDTAWWRSLGSYLNIGDEVQFGSVTYVVTMKDTEDYQAAWSVPGSIVVQYSPTNHPEKTMGHISVALGTIEYTDISQVTEYLYNEYGILLDRNTCTGLPMVYDPYGPAAGHTIFKINANGVANCVIVDNNYASDPEWIEPVCLVFSPKE